MAPGPAARLAWVALLGRAIGAVGGEPAAGRGAAEAGSCAAGQAGCGTSGVTLLQTRNRITTVEGSSFYTEDDDIALDEANVTAPVAAGSPETWVTSHSRVGAGWCSAEVPASGWSLKRGRCGGSADLTVLTYNVFWWNLYGQRGGNGGSASRLIKEKGPFDIIGFQECDNPWRVMNEAGLGHYGVIPGHHATAIAFDQSKWRKVAAGLEDVAEDRPEQHYGRREIGWARLQNIQSRKVVFVVNHHGPLPVNTGGICGAEATAFNILKVMGTKAEPGDFKLLLGDLNADANSATQSELGRRMHRIAANWVDGIFASCPRGRSERLGKGGSDHDALKAVLKI